MKKLFIFLALNIAFLSSCSKEVFPGSESNKGTIVANILEEKTTLDGLNIKWASGDQIGVYGDTDRTARCYSLTSEPGSTTGTFSSLDPCPDNNLFALYPYNKVGVYNANYHTLDILNEQTYEEGNVKDLYMYGTGDTENGVQFNCLNGIIRLSLWSKTAKTIDNIVITSDDVLAKTQLFKNWDFNNPLNSYSSRTEKSIFYTVNAAISTDNANPSVYNIQVAPGVKRNLTIIINSGNSFAGLTKSSLTVSAGVISKMSEKELEFESGSKMIKFDDGDWEDFTLSMTIPSGTSKVALKTASIYALDANDIATLKTMFTANAITEPLDELDLSNTNILCLGSGALRSIKVKKVVLPSKIVEFNDYVFQYSSVTEVDLPEGMTTAMGAMNGASTYIKWVVDANNMAYKSGPNGELLSKDGTILYAASNGNVVEGVYTIPAGVTTLKGYAVSQVQLASSIVWPESVLTLVDGPVFAQSRNISDVYIYTKTVPNVCPFANANSEITPGRDAATRTIHVQSEYLSAFKAAWGGLETRENYKWTIKGDLDGSSLNAGSPSIKNLESDGSKLNNPNFWKN